MSKLEELYYEFTNGNDDADTEKVQTAFNKCSVMLKDLKLEKELYFLYEATIMELSAANEKQGFMKGFKYAMQLAAEIFSKEGAVNV